MESRNKLIMCRLCLDENGCFINVFERNDLHSYIAAEVITDLLQFQVSDADGYPQVVCLTCLAKLTEFKMFKERCHESKVKYDTMFVSSERPEDHRPDMWEFGTVKAEPIFYSDNEGDLSKEVGSGSEFCDQDPLREASSQLTINSEESIIDSCSYKISEDSLNTPEVSCGPILLKYEVLPFSRDSHPQKELIDSNRSGNQGRVELMQDSPQMEEGKGTAPEKGIRRRYRRFQCHCCMKVLITKGGLKGQLTSHGIGAFFKCDICGKMLASKSNLVNHMQKHTHDKPFKCTGCSKSYSHYHSLKVHMRIHTEIKPFKCEKCGLSFNQSIGLEKHILRIHSGLRPYSCEVCHANFKQMNNLTWHMRSHRKE